MLNISSRDSIYQIMKNLSYPEILKLCTGNKELQSICNNKLIQDLLIIKRFESYYDFIRAVQSGDLNLVNEFIERGLNPAANDNSPIVHASEFGQLDIVNRLLEDPRVDPTVDHNIAIDNAAGNYHWNVVRRLLDEPRVKRSLTAKEKWIYLTNMSKWHEDRGLKYP